MSIHRSTLAGFGLAALLGLGLGACFTGSDAEGLPCTNDAQCGLRLACIEGWCGGSLRCADGTLIPVSQVCDGVEDCESGEDEDAQTCNTDAFFCDDDSTLPLEQTCDGSPDCPDGEDEAPALCELHDLCEGASEAFAFDPGPSGPGIGNPLGVFSGRLVGDARPDIVLAQRGGSFVRVFDVPEEGEAIGYDLPGDNTESPFFLGGVQEVIAYDFEQDTDTDLLVLTGDAKLFGYVNEGDGLPPVLSDYSPVIVPTSPEVPDIAMGNINGDAWADVVAISVGGLLLTATGDAAAGAAGENPFQIEIGTLQIPGSTWHRVVLADLDDDGEDELLVTGEDASPTLWVLDRTDVVLEPWAFEGDPVVLPFAGLELAVGEFDDQAGADIAVGNASGLVILRRMGSGFVSTSTVDVGAEFEGLAAVDFDCSGRDELIFNVGAPAGVRVAFTGEAAELDPAYSITLESAGRPAGGLALMKYDQDESWDVFHVVEAAGGLDQPEFRSHLSSP